MNSSTSFTERNLSHRMSHQARIESMIVVAILHDIKMWSLVSSSKLHAPHMVIGIVITYFINATADGIFPSFALHKKHRILKRINLSHSNGPSLTT